MLFMYVTEILDQSIWGAHTLKNSYIISRDHINKIYVVSAKTHVASKLPFITQTQRSDLGTFRTWKKAKQSCEQHARQQ